MSRPRVDYDRLAERYDARYRENTMTGVGAALRDLAHRFEPRRILDAGCGTGHWLKEWGVFAVGLDRSWNMLQRVSVQVPRVQGHANALPFRAGFFDFIYAVNALHHFDDPLSYLRDASALLTNGGVLAVVTLDPRSLRHRWYVYDYFPGVWDTDLVRFPSLPAIVETMQKSGVEGVETRMVERISRAQRGRAIFEDPFLVKDSNSQLALLSESDYQEGLRRMEQACCVAEEADREVVFQVDLALHLIWGRRGRV